MPIGIGIGSSPSGTTFSTPVILQEFFYAKDYTMPACYILYSKTADRFYIGGTGETVSERFRKHIEGFYGNKYTGVAKDWEVFLIIECATTRQAFAVEKHIKRMKSRKYIENLKRYPEMAEGLLKKHS